MGTSASIWLENWIDRKKNLFLDLFLSELSFSMEDNLIKFKHDELMGRGKNPDAAQCHEPLCLFGEGAEAVDEFFCECFDFFV